MGHLQKWVRRRKMCHTCKNYHTWIKVWVNLEKYVKLEKSRSRVEKCVTLAKWVPLRKISHTSKNGSHLDKWVTFRKVGDT